MNKKACLFAFFLAASAFAQTEEATQPFALPEAYEPAVEAATSELAKLIEPGLAAMDDDGDGKVKLLSLVKVLRATGFGSVDTTAQASSRGRAGRGGRGGGAGQGRGHGGGGRGGRGGAGSDMVASRFAQMDSDSDGKLTGGEIGPRMQGTERAADNVVTLDEFKAAWAEMFGAGGGRGGSGRHGGGGGGGVGGAGHRHGGGGGHGGGRGGRSAAPISSDAKFVVNLDINKDRVLTADEVAAALKADLIVNLETNVSRDTNADGTITTEEFTSPAPETIAEGESEPTPRRGRGRGRFAFSRMDQDGDGELTSAEVVTEALRKCQPRVLALSICLQHFAGGAKELSQKELSKFVELTDNQWVAAGFDGKPIALKDSYAKVLAAVRAESAN